MHPLLAQLCQRPAHVVVVCGGAVSGSEAALACIEHGVTAVVLEQNTRPYGKIEDGLPRWHDKLRAKEYQLIDSSLSRPGVFYVPCTKVGADLSFETLVRGFGASAVLLANGAWRDRPLSFAMPTEVDLVMAGLVYQSSFVYWFNHYEEPGYVGPRYQVHDDAIVVGGGLASIDVAKIINLELYRSALERRGIRVSIVELEHAGIPETLHAHGLSVAELGVRGCTIYYRRRVKDMPVAFPRPGATPEQVLKTEAVREKLIAILKEKFCIDVRDCAVPSAPIVESGRLVGLRFLRTELRDGKLVELAGSELDVRSELIVSSIGSVPEPVPGVPTKGELYDFASWQTGALRGLPGVFGLGNVLTGKGNIKDSRHNAREVSELMVRDYLGLGERTSDVDVLGGAHDAARSEARAVVQSAIRRAKVPVEKLRPLAEAIDARWRAVGYDGDYAHWIEQHRPFA